MIFLIEGERSIENIWSIKATLAKKKGMKRKMDTDSDIITKKKLMNQTNIFKNWVNDWIVRNTKVWIYQSTILLMINKPINFILS